jgi:hypothetical protein
MEVRNVNHFLASIVSVDEHGAEKFTWGFKSVVALLTTRQRNAVGERSKKPRRFSKRENDKTESSRCVD